MLYQFRLILFCCSVFLGSCSTKDKSHNQYSIRDTVLKKHLLEINSLPYYDTSEINYKVLKAYINNDTVFFKTLNNQIKLRNNDKRRWFLSDTCIHQQKLQDLKVDEAYRFIYYPAFCFMPINVTVTKKGDLANLHFLLYQNNYDDYSCKIISQFQKRLTPKEWEEFSYKLSFADVWGLKRENGIHGLDGSTLTFIGYQKGNPDYNRPDKICYVNRWAFSTLNDALTLILKISGNNKGCYWVK